MLDLQILYPSSEFTAVGNSPAKLGVVFIRTKNIISLTSYIGVTVSLNLAWNLNNHSSYLLFTTTITAVYYGYKNIP